ncbi:MAG: DNA polymerase III subunit gamma/tau [Chitinophagales bacterium]|jgi:DNA polymerase-3 subunit gamma/tau|nr:DNA polymerase III subunit gamma/tau [Chitinophagales bacterium]
MDSPQFVASARKYRPSKFNEVVGQDMTIDTLKKSILTDHLSHAYMFCGPRGVGKTTIARIFAKTINCLNITEDGEACNVCSSCASFNQNSSFNIIEIDAASRNKVEEIKSSVIDLVKYQPQNAKYKIFIIDEVHMLTSQAFNAFLKTLEEPPSYVKFVMATTDKHKILPTILSRCQVYDFKRIDVNSIVSYLIKICNAEQIDYDQESLELIAAKSDGGLRDALSLFDRLCALNQNKLVYDAVVANLNILDFEHFFKFTQAIQSEDYATCLTLIDEIYDLGFEAEAINVGFADHLRNILLSKDAKTNQLLHINQKYKPRYLEVAKSMELSFLMNLIQVTSDTDTSLKYAQNKRLLLELSFMKQCYINKLTAFSMTQVIEQKKNPN